MRAKIAVATVSGKVYYLLVRELKRRGLHFLSLKPTDRVPLNVDVVITTGIERPLITHPSVLTFQEEMNPTEVVDEAVRVLKGKQGYSRVVVGVDPGRTFGVAVVGDGTVLEAVNCASLRETVDTVSKALDGLQAKIQRVKIGDGDPQHTKILLDQLDRALPEGVVIETVHEAGTSQIIRETTHRRELRDAMSAVKIAERSGRVYRRGKQDEAHRRKG